MTKCTAMMTKMTKQGHSGFQPRAANKLSAILSRVSDSDHVSVTRRLSPEVGRGRDVQAEAGEVGGGVSEQEEDGGERRDGVQRPDQQHHLKPCNKDLLLGLHLKDVSHHYLQR